MNKIVKSITAEFSTKTIVLIPICAGINLVGGSIAGALKLPVFLDLIGTILGAALGGPWVAAVIGFVTNLFLALVSNPTYFPYVLVSIAVGLQTGYRGDFYLSRCNAVVYICYVVCYCVFLWRSDGSYRCISGDSGADSLIW